jgi:hypothetical protein
MVPVSVQSTEFVVDSTTQTMPGSPVIRGRVPCREGSGRASGLTGNSRTPAGDPRRGRAAGWDREGQGAGGGDIPAAPVGVRNLILPFDTGCPKMGLFQSAWVPSGCHATRCGGRSCPVKSIWDQMVLLGLLQSSVRRSCCWDMPHSPPAWGRATRTEYFPA